MNFPATLSNRAISTLGLGLAASLFALLLCPRVIAQDTALKDLAETPAVEQAVSDLAPVDGAELPAVDELPVLDLLPADPAVPALPAEAADAKPAAAPEKGATFDWTWDEAKPGDRKEAATNAGSGSAQDPAPLMAEPEWEVKDVPAVAAAPAVSGDTLKDLMKENLDLRRQIEELDKGKTEALKQRDALRRDVQDLEKRVAEAASAVSAMRKDRPAGDKQWEDRVKELEAKLAGLERTAAEKDAEIAQLRQMAADLKSGAKSDDPGVAPGSGLFRQIEKENVLLRQKLVEAETARSRAMKRSESVDKLEQELAEAKAQQVELQQKMEEAKATEKQHRDAVERLLERIPGMEEELARLRLAVAEQSKTIQGREEELRTVSLELQKREHRVVKAERMAQLLEQTRSDVRRVNDKEKRDMHYNMATVYVREGRFKEAEQEYLKALDMDPTDSDIHYNLGILYDDELNDKRRAALHYRRYLKLQPYGADVDKVKGWLMRLETGGM